MSAARLRHEGPWGWMRVRPETAYARDGDVSIAYQVLGTGPVDLVLIPGWISHLDFQWIDPTYARFLERLAGVSRLIMFDKRGVGLSDPALGTPSVEDRMSDVRVVMDAVDSQRAVLFGLSEGGPIAALFAATYPDRTAGLVLYGTYPCGPGARGYGGFEKHTEMFDHIRQVLADGRWGRGDSLEVFAPEMARSRALRVAWGMFERASLSPSMALALLDFVWDLDVRPILGSIQTPTLVLHRRGDLIPIEGGRYLASNIPGARLVELDGNAHVPIEGDTEALIDRIAEFITGRPPASRADRAVVTILFTDIVGSTERAAREGDDRWRDLLARHNQLVDEQIARFDGIRVNHTGDGIVARFNSPANAIACARAASDALDNLGLVMRAGVHTGECELVDDGIVGLAVHIASRIASLAGPGEILASQTVRDLMIGSATTFGDRGKYELKGVPGTWDICIVTATGGRTTALPHEPMPVSVRVNQVIARRLPGLSRSVVGLVKRRNSQRS